MAIPQEQISVRATYMRGGTSKGVFFTPDDLPDALRNDPAALDRFMLRVIGSPDPYGKHTDGMGAATSSTSKVVLVSKSSRPDCDVDYRFGAVAIEKPQVDWSGNCGNLTSAVGPFAIARGFITAPRNGIAIVRIWQANIRKKIIAYVEVHNGQVVELGDFELDGVAFPGAEVRLEFLDPGADKDSEARAMFPTGHRADTLDVPSVGAVEATLINAGNPTIFIHAATVGLHGTELQDAVNNNGELLARLEAIRARAAVAMGLATSVQEATAKFPHMPRIAMVARPATYTASGGKTVAANVIDLTARIMSMGKLHHAMSGTGAVATAVAATIPGTLVNAVRGGAANLQVRLGHPSGIFTVGVEAAEVDGQWTVTKVMLARSARRLMDGRIFVPN
jgi:probable AcnD-accessory protein PrpF